MLCDLQLTNLSTLVTFQVCYRGEFTGGPVVRTQASVARGTGSIPCWEIRSLMLQGQKAKEILKNQVFSSDMWLVAIMWALQA